MYLVLDTSVLIDIEKNVELTKQKLLSLRQNLPLALAITSITYTEIFRGYLKIGKNQDEIEDILEKYILLNTTKNSSIIAADIMNILYEKGKPIPVQDILIASIAIDSGGILATKDPHFQDVQNLKVIMI